MAEFVTLVLTVTVPAGEAEAAKDAIVDGLNSDDCPSVAYSTAERAATDEEANTYLKLYGEPD